MIDKKQTKISTRAGIIIILSPFVLIFLIIVLNPNYNLKNTNDTTQIQNAESQDVVSKSIPTKQTENDVATEKLNYLMDNMDTYIQAQEFVKQTLKSPSTAKFPALPYEIVDLGDSFYKVSSYVDSQNSFGATIRNEWSVKMALVLDHWFLDKMTFNGKVVYDASSSN